MDNIEKPGLFCGGDLLLSSVLTSAMETVLIKVVAGKCQFTMGIKI